MNPLSTPAEQIANGLQVYKDYLEICLYEEYPAWVVDIADALKRGEVTPLLGKDYAPWVIGAYNQLKSEGQPVA